MDCCLLVCVFLLTVELTSFSSKYVFIALLERSTIFDIALIGRYIFLLLFQTMRYFEIILRQKHLVPRGCCSMVNI